MAAGKLILVKLGKLSKLNDYYFECTGCKDIKVKSKHSKIDDKFYCYYCAMKCLYDNKCCFYEATLNKIK